MLYVRYILGYYKTKLVAFFVFSSFLLDLFCQLRMISRSEPKQQNCLLKISARLHMQNYLDEVILTRPTLENEREKKKEDENTIGLG